MDSGGLVGAPHADERAAVDLAPAPRAGPEPQRARWYSWSLFAVACLAGLLLAASGAPMPPVWVVVVLGVLIALSLHHVAFFPSQWSATAEAAVLLAAVVGFAGAAADQGAGAATVLGPWAVAFLCGPLDTLHWKEHAFWRMAFNAGNRMIAVLLATLAFNGAHGISRPLFGGGVPWGPFAAAALAASVVFALVDLVLFLGFERFGRGESVRAALREYVVVDSLTVPLGLVGAGAGYLALRLGWWAGALALVPVPFAPELILVRARRAVHGARLTRAMRGVAPIATGALVLIGLFAFLVELPDPVQLAGLVVVALVAGIELRVDARMQVPAMIATLVAGALLLDGEDAFAPAVVLAVTATATACLLAAAHLVAAAPRGRRDARRGVGLRRAPVASRRARGGAGLRARVVRPRADDRVDGADRRRRGGSRIHVAHARERGRRRVRRRARGGRRGCGRTWCTAVGQPGAVAVRDAAHRSTPSHAVGRARRGHAHLRVERGDDLLRSRTARVGHGSGRCSRRRDGDARRASVALCATPTDG